MGLKEPRMGLKVPNAGPKEPNAGPKARAVKEPKAIKEAKDPDKCKKGTKLRGTKGTKAGLKKPNTH